MLGKRTKVGRWLRGINGCASQLIEMVHFFKLIIIKIKINNNKLKKVNFTNNCLFLFWKNK